MSDDFECRCVGPCNGNPKPGEFCREADSDIVYVRRTPSTPLPLTGIAFLGNRPPNVKPALDYKPSDDDEDTVFVRPLP